MKLAIPKRWAKVIGWGSLFTFFCFIVCVLGIVGISIVFSATFAIACNALFTTTIPIGFVMNSIVLSVAAWVGGLIGILSGIVFSRSYYNNLVTENSKFIKADSANTFSRVISYLDHSKVKIIAAKPENQWLTARDMPKNVIDTLEHFGCEVKDLDPKKIPDLKDVNWATLIEPF